MKPRDRTLPVLVLTMEGTDLCRCGIKSGGAEETSRSMFERGGELCGRCIIGTGELDVRAGRGLWDEECKLANFGDMEVPQVSSCCIFAFSITIEVFRLVSSFVRQLDDPKWMYARHGIENRHEHYGTNSDMVGICPKR